MYLIHTIIALKQTIPKAVILRVYYYINGIYSGVTFTKPACLGHTRVGSRVLPYSGRYPGTPILGKEPGYPHTRVGTRVRPYSGRHPGIPTLGKVPGYPHTREGTRVLPYSGRYPGTPILGKVPGYPHTRVGTRVSPYSGRYPDTPDLGTLLDIPMKYYPPPQALYCRAQKC